MTFQDIELISPGVGEFFFFTVLSCSINICCVMCFLLLGDWIRERVEPPDAMKMTDAERKILMARLIRSSM